MNRNLVWLVLVALFTISVIAIAASSLDSAPIESGFGIDGDPADGRIDGASGTGAGAGGGSDSGRGGSGLFESTVSSTHHSTDSGSIPLLLIIVGVGVLATSSIALIVWATGSETTPQVTTESSSLESSDDAMAVETGESSIGKPANAVYRAWWEMVQQLDVARPQSRSPAEFATVAIDAGMDPEMVAELTTLFRSVRYGDAAITDDAERRALAAIAHLRSQTDSADRGGTDS